MKPNVLRVVVAISFLVAVIGAYLFGKSSGKHEAETAAAEQGAERGDSSGLSALGEGRVRPGDGDATNPDGSPASQASVKSIISKARMKMQGGMMNMSGMMRALALLDEISDEQIQEALAEVERSVKEPQQKAMFGMLLLARWAEKDGRGALAYAEENFSSKNPMMMGMKSGVITSWAQADPDAAWEWFNEQDPDEGDGNMFGNNNRSMALMGIIGSLAMKDPDLAFDRLEQIENDGERQMALQGLGQAIWDEGRRERILSRIETMENASEKTAARSAVISQWTQMDPDGAIAWADTLEPADRSAVVKQIGQGLSWMDPERSGELTLSVATTPEERSQAYSNTISSWAHNDPYAAGEWLSDQEQGPELDQARQQFATSVAQKDPVSAMAWADAVSEETKRGSAVQSVYMQWRGKDQEAADAALAGVELSDEKKAEIKEMKATQLPYTTLYGTGVGAVMTETTEAVDEAEAQAIEALRGAIEKASEGE